MSVYKNHASYGIASFNRCSGGSIKLFGSHLDHSGHIELTIKRCEVSNDLGRAWYFGREELIEVRMSNAQFVDLITNMNTQGTPCTLSRVNGVKQDKVPEEHKTESQEVINEFRNNTKKFVEKELKKKD